MMAKIKIKEYSSYRVKVFLNTNLTEWDRLKESVRINEVTIFYSVYWSSLSFFLRASLFNYPLFITCFREGYFPIPV